MISAQSADIARKFVVESFQNHDPPDERQCNKHFEFATSDQALRCARRIIDKSLRRTHNSTRTSVEWYRYWSAYGESVIVPGTKFNSRCYAKMRIRMIGGPKVGI